MAPAFASMMLMACASAGANDPVRPAPDPVVVTRVQTRLVCPAELALAVPERAAVPAGAEIRANPAGDAYLDAKDGRETLLAQRLTDAAAQCP